MQARLTKSSTRPEMIIVLNRVIYESEMKAPISENPFDNPTKLVMVVDALATPICKVCWRYVTKFRDIDNETELNMAAVTTKFK